MSESTPDLAKLAEPFPAEDIEWRVSRSGRGRGGTFCMVLAYITARAIQNRLDDVVGPANWKNTEPRIVDINGKSAFAVGLSIRVGDEWLPKWDVSEPTNIEPAKGGFSGAMKRAGAQWGIGRYLYHLDETFAECVDDDPGRGVSGWNYARLGDKYEKAPYWWKTPTLPGWALPKEPAHEISEKELTELKKAWRRKFHGDEQLTLEAMREGFSRFVVSVAGEFPLADFKCWTRQALEACRQKIERTSDADGIDGDVPFGDA